MRACKRGFLGKCYKFFLVCMLGGIIYIQLYVMHNDNSDVDVDERGNMHHVKGRKGDAAHRKSKRDTKKDTNDVYDIIEKAKNILRKIKKNEDDLEQDDAHKDTGADGNKAPHAKKGKEKEKEKKVNTEEEKTREKKDKAKNNKHWPNRGVTLPGAPDLKKFEGPFPDSGVLPDKGAQDLVDYHNHIQEMMDVMRTGLGEQGKKARLSDEDRYSEQYRKLYDDNGFNALLSNQIALDRSLEDRRHPKCRDKRYRAKLPTVSVVIPVFEEHGITLLRTITSVINRSPPHLIKEIILVDDGSTLNPFLKDPLDLWLKKNMPKAWVLRLPERNGLIRARQEGAMRATGDVILVLDSHCEVSVNWLPPLLDPIASDYRVVVCPLIDAINPDTFAYGIQDDGGRGGFDWKLYYKRMPLPPDDKKALPENYESPVMNGGLFALSRKFFLELGGYDPGLLIWGGEQYELSFKIWQCGGRMLDSPCSRVGHVFRHGGINRPGIPAHLKGVNTLAMNYKRVGLVWMDEYINVLYKKMPHLRFQDPGDITRQLQIRKKLQCKPFKWFLETVAPDLLEHYPPFEQPDFANGTVKSVANSSMCMENFNKALVLRRCSHHRNQEFHLCWRKMIREWDEQFCWTSNGKGNAPYMVNCKNIDPYTTQLWRYDPILQQLREKKDGLCLELVDNSKLSIESCDPTKVAQKWLFSSINKELVDEKFPPF